MRHLFVHWLLVLFVLFSGIAYAHEHWILTDAATDADGTITFRIGSGHRFPDSDTLLAERLLVETIVTAPNGKAQPLNTGIHDRFRTGTVRCDQPGTWAFSFALQRPRQTEPLHRGRCILVNGGKDDPVRYTNGTGLEIAPGAALSEMFPGATLPLRILHDGHPIGGAISVTPENGPSFFLSTTSARPAQLPIRQPAAWLLTVTDRGRTFSLTFRTPPAPALPVKHDE